MKFLIKLLKGILSLSLLTGLLCTYAIYIEPYRLDVKDFSLPVTQGTEQQTLSVVQFSDTHLGFHYDIEELKKAVQQMNAQQPDLIFFTGDLIDHAHEYDRIDEIAPVLGQLKAKYGKYAVYGNHDYGGGAMGYYPQIMADSGFYLLVNETGSIQLPDGTSIGISGLDEAYFGDPQPERLAQQFAQFPYNILLLHEPDIIDQFTVLPDLTVAGHSHGGQIRIPLVGPLITTRYAEQYTDGFYPLGNGQQLYVNIGLGTTRIPMRFAAIPEITVFHLQFGR